MWLLLRFTFLDSVSLMRSHCLTYPSAFYPLSGPIICLCCPPDISFAFVAAVKFVFIQKANRPKCSMRGMSACPKSYEYNGEKSFAIAFEFVRILDIYFGGISWHFCPSVTVSGVWRKHGAGSSHHIPRCIDPLGGCVLLHLLGVHGHVARDARRLLKKGLRAPAGKMLQRRIIKLCAEIDTIGSYVLFVAAAVWGAQDART